MDVIGLTVLFVRKEKSPTELIPDLQGYGHTFPEAYTTWDPEVRDSCSHQRVIQYDFGGLRFLVRTETDGYVKNGDAKELPGVTNATTSSSLEGAHGKMTVSSTNVSQDQELVIRMQGKRVRQDQIFDIKTRASFKTYYMNDILPRLWLN